MKNILIGLCLFILSCEKQEPKPQTWYLYISIPSYGYTAGNIPVSSIKDNLDAHHQKIGLRLEFRDSRLYVVICTENGNVTKIEGDIDGKHFNVQNGLMNICNGQQQVEFTYNLEIK